MGSGFNSIVGYSFLSVVSATENSQGANFVCVTLPSSIFYAFRQVCISMLVVYREFCMIKLTHCHG